MIDDRDSKNYTPVPKPIEAMQYIPARRDYDKMITWAGARLGAEPTRHRMYIRVKARSGTNWDHSLQVEVKPYDWVCIRPDTDSIFKLSAQDFAETYTRPTPVVVDTKKKVSTESTSTSAGKR